MDDDGGGDNKDGADDVRDVESYDVMLCHKKARARRGVKPHVVCVVCGVPNWCQLRPLQPLQRYPSMRHWRLKKIHVCI